MTERKYYLCEGKLPQTVVADYLKTQIRREAYVDAVGNNENPLDGKKISLNGYKVERRDGKQYTHLLIEGENDAIAGIEAHILDQDSAILGMHKTDYGNIVNVMNTYLPRKDSSVANFTKSVGKSVAKSWAPYSGIAKSFALVGTVGATFALGAMSISHLNHYMTIKNQENLAESRLRISENESKSDLIKKVESLKRQIQQYEQTSNEEVQE